MAQDTLDLLVDAKVKWVHENVKTLSGFQPRHIGRVASATVYRSDDENSYDSFDVIGILSGTGDGVVIIADEVYPWDRIANLRVYRRELN